MHHAAVAHVGSEQPAQVCLVLAEWRAPPEGDREDEEERLVGRAVGEQATVSDPPRWPTPSVPLGPWHDPSTTRRRPP